MADQISICNMALAEVVAAPIESLNERSLEARETGRYYDQALVSLMESHPWGFATRRATLAETVNARPGEWSGSFALPTDVARPIKVMSASSITGSQGWWADDRITGANYAIEDNILYCSLRDPVLAYTTSAITAAAFPAKFVDALALELASRIAMPIKKSREMRGDLLKQAEVAKQRAMADDMNRQPTNDEWVDEVALARGGWSGSDQYWRR
jgi:hypothetical protein